MSFLKRYDVTEKIDELIIVRGRIRQLVNSIIYLTIVFVWYSVLMGQNPNFDNPLMYLFFVAPFFLVPTIVKSVKNTISPDKIEFNAKLGDLIINDRRRAKLSSITKVIVDYSISNERSECTLELVVEGQRNIIIDQSDAGFNKEVIKTAKRIGAFLKIPAEDLKPVEKLF